MNSGRYFNNKITLDVKRGKNRIFCGRQVMMSSKCIKEKKSVDES